MGAPRNIPVYRVTAPPNQGGDGVSGRSFGWVVGTGTYRTRTKNNGADPTRGSFFNAGETWYGIVARRVLSTSGRGPGRSNNWHDEPVSGYSWGSVSPDSTDIYVPTGTSFDTGNPAEDVLEYTSGCSGAAGQTHWNLPFQADDWTILFYKILFKQDCTGTFARWRQRLAAPNLSAGPEINLTNVKTLNPASNWFPGVQFWEGCYISSGFMSGSPVVLDVMLSMWGKSWQQAWDDIPQFVEFQENSITGNHSSCALNGSINTASFPIPNDIAAQLTDPPGSTGGGGGTGGGDTGSDPAFPTTPVIDSATISDTTSPPGWIKDRTGGFDSGIGVVSNKFVANTSGDHDSYLSGDYGPDVEAYCTISSIPSAGSSNLVRVMARGINFGTANFGCYQAQYGMGSLYPGGGQIALSKAVNGVFTQIGTPVNITPAVGDKLGISCIGDQIRVYRFTAGAWQQTPIIKVTDSSILSPGKIGLRLSDVTLADDFGGGTLSSSAGHDYHPLSDISAGAWKTQAGSGSSLFATLDEDNPDDADYVISSLSPSSADIFEVKFEPVVDPGVDTGHIINYRIGKNGAGGDRIDLTVRLRQGTTDIAVWTHSDIPGTLANISQTLTPAQAAAITDYTDLRLRFEAIKYVAGGGGSFPVSALISSFTGTDENPLSEGGIWAAGILNGTTAQRPRRLSNAAANQASGNTEVQAYTAASYGPNVEVYATLPVVPVAAQTPPQLVSVYGRVTPSSTVPSFYQMLVKNGIVQLWKAVSGTFTNLSGDISRSMAAGDKFGMSISGTTITLYWKSGAGAWTQIGQYTDASISGSGKLAFNIQDSIVNGLLRIDDFGGGTI